jgi:opacity protein-like surface antigen
MAHNGHRLRGLIVSCTALVLLASPAFAKDQNQSANSSAQSAPSSPPDFLLGRPRVMVGVRGSWFKANAGSDIYDFITDQFTVDKSDFSAGSFTAEMAVNVTSRLDITGGIDFNGMSKPSEDRDEEELLPNGSRIPIEQVTELEQMNLFASAKFSLLPRGRRVSSLAWIPNTFVPYVGAGGGYGKYTMRQNGDFVDFVDHHIFTDTFRSEGWAPIFNVMGGTDIQVMRRLVLSFEARYSWQHADLDSDFVDFDPIDLGGLRFGAGIHFAF